MKQRRKVAILLVATLVLQMMPLPMGSLAGVLGIFSVSQAADASGKVGDVTWTVTGTKLTLTGTGTTEMQSCGRKPSSDYSDDYYRDENNKKYKGPAAAWGKYAQDITSVEVTKVKALGDYAFYHFENLTSVTMTGVTKIGSHAFDGCSSLTETALSLNGVTDVGSYAFAETAFTKVIWPAGNNTISAGAFQGCSSITTIAIPSGVDTLGASAFNFCSGATAITGLDNVTSIGTGAFKSCNKLTDISWPSGLTTISESAFAECEGLEAITIPDNITQIERLAFSGCGRKGMNSKQVTVTIPDKVTSIGDNAFSNCKITGVVIGEKVTSIGKNAFYNCSRLESFECKARALNTIDNNAFSGTNLTKFTVPETVTSIGTNPFIGGSFNEIAVESGNKKYTVENKMLVTKDEPKTVISYPRNAGRDAVVPDTVKTIGESAFQSTGISTVALPEGLTSMGTYAFSSSGLTTVKLPKSLKSISQYAFSNTNKLKSIELQQGLETIEEGAFQQTALTSVNFPGSLLTIGEYAFQLAGDLTSINGEGGSLKTVKNFAFAYCTKLNDVRFGGDLDSLGHYAFYGCTSISEITLPDKLRVLGTSVFQGCSSLKGIVFPNSIESIGTSVLSECSSLESVDFGSIIKEIKGNVFEGCLKLSRVTISKNNPYMTAEDNVLYNKEKTRIIYYAAALPDDKFYVPDSVTTVGEKAFNYCSGLKELKFPETVTKMDDLAVYKNTSINKIFFYGNAPEVKTASTPTERWENGKKITTYSETNAAVQDNNKALMIFVLKKSTGWETGWEAPDRTDTDTKKYVWKKQYELDKDRWDPTKTDVVQDKFDTGLGWIYRDDIGEVTFVGKGVTPDFEDDNLFKWVNQNATEGLQSIGKIPDYSQDVRSVDTGDAEGIGKNTFKKCSKLYRVFTSDESKKYLLKEIKESAFADCESLAVVDVSNVEKIGKEAFKKDTAIKDDMDARGVQEIGEGAFSGCNGMTEILLGEGLKSLGKETFANCSSLESMMLPESTESLGEGCFTGCSSLRTINIPANIQNIPAASFKDCSELQKVYFYGDCPESREADAFVGCRENLVIYSTFP